MNFFLIIIKPFYEVQHYQRNKKFVTTFQTVVQSTELIFVTLMRILNQKHKKLSYE